MADKSRKKALITGITGQDGSYLAEFLLSKNYVVHGIVRKSSTFNTSRIDHIYVDPHTQHAKFFLHHGDLSDAEQINNIIYNIKPDEIYHLAAQSHVRVSFDIPEYTGNIVALGTTRILETIRRSGNKSKFYQASSSEMFGSAKAPQSEETAFKPQSPYACAKLYSYWMAQNYRRAYGLFVCNGILFNHESPRRGETFVTRKVTRAIASILSGKQDRLFLGNLNAKRDWGFAPEYIQMMWLMLQQDQPDDYVIGTGVNHSVREFVEEAFKYVGITIKWVGKGKREQGIIQQIDFPEPLSEIRGLNTCLKKGNTIVQIDPDYFRPNEVESLRADIKKAKKKLKWKPKVTFYDIVKIMVDYDLKNFGFHPVGAGIDICKKKGYPG